MTALPLLLLTAIANASEVHEPSLAAQLERGDTLPDVTLLVEGQERALSDLGDLRVVELASTYCRPCMAGLEQLNEHAGRYRDDGVEFVVIFTDDNSERIAAAIEPYPTDNLVIAELTIDARRALTNGATPLPTSFVLDPDHEILARWTGNGDSKSLTNWALRTWFRKQKRLARKQAKADQAE